LRYSAGDRRSSVDGREAGGAPIDGELLGGMKLR
jgi:hypothetical protein